MLSSFVRFAALTVLVFAVGESVGLAQSPAPVCHCSAASYPHYHLGRGQAGPSTAPGQSSYGARPRPRFFSGSAAEVNGLPRGRRYYGGRFFGSFNNRYYSPQYGYF